MLLVRTLRLTRELKQSEVAEQVRIGRSYLSKIERGAYTPPATIRRRLAEFFGVDPDLLLSVAEVANE